MTFPPLATHASDFVVRVLIPRLSLLGLTAYSAAAAEIEMPTEAALRGGAAEAAIMDHFKGEFPEPKDAAERAKQFTQVLEGREVISLQLDSDKEKECVIWFQFWSGNHHNGEMAIADWKDGKWRILGFMFGSDPATAKEQHDGYFDLNTAHNVGGGEYYLISYRFTKGRYKEAGKEKKKLEGH